MCSIHWRVRGCGRRRARIRRLVLFRTLGEAPLQHPLEPSEGPRRLVRRQRRPLPDHLRAGQARRNAALGAAAGRFTAATPILEDAGDLADQAEAEGFDVVGHRIVGRGFRDFAFCGHADLQCQ